MLTTVVQLSPGRSTAGQHRPGSNTFVSCPQGQVVYSFVAPYRTSSYHPEKAVGSCKGTLPALTQLFMDIYYITLEMSDIYLYRWTVRSPRLSTCQARHSRISVKGRALRCAFTQLICIYAAARVSGTAWDQAAVCSGATEYPDAAQLLQQLIPGMSAAHTGAF